VAFTDGLPEVAAFEAPPAASACRRELLDEDENRTRDGQPGEDEEQRGERQTVPGHFDFFYRPRPRGALELDLRMGYSSPLANGL
jgi:hypothetical protein